MRLIKLKLRNFRRFADEQSLDLNESLIALVGPNEAGKSSLLRALEAVGQGRAGVEASYRTRLTLDPVRLSAIFVLDEEDQAALEGIPGGPETTHVEIVHREGVDSNYWTVSPDPPTHIPYREETAGLLRGSDESWVTREIVDEGSGQPVVDAALLDSVHAVLSSTESTISENAISQLTQLAGQLETYAGRLEASLSEEEGSSESSDPSPHRKAAASLRGLVEIERGRSPWRRIVNVLSARVPQVVEFKAEDRELVRTYDLAAVAQDCPPALRNLCALAELDLTAISAAISLGQAPYVQGVVEQANERLKESFTGAWRQSQVYPHFSAPLEGVLQLMVRSEGAEAYSYPDERSDGLLWFIALHAFLMTHEERNPILLVDEAETHLHYDAQADLVDALMSQQTARQVVYTTHSIGCLPPDLGAGVRAVVPDGPRGRSRIHNSCWAVGPVVTSRLGFTPLLFAMGARMLSLTVPRAGVVVEGPADAVLLPTAFREVTGLQTLPYRLVPGLSEVPEDAVQELSHHGGAVVCLVDGDEGGQGIKDKLVAGGFPAEKIFSLKALREGCTLEDIVLSDVFARAVNQEITNWGLGTLRVNPEELPASGRWAWLEDRAEQSGTLVASLSKPRVAQRVVDISRDSTDPGSKVPVVDPTFADALRALHTDLCEGLDL